MIERVQIQGGSDGVYYDSKGRRLRTMGDFAPSPGQWVYTNGVTIYGHQTAAQQPIVFTGEKPIFPFIAYFNGVQGLFEINKKAVPSVALNAWYITAYVGNNKVAYARLYSKEKSGWYNLKSGEYLGEFGIDDACVGDDGSLLSISSDRCEYCCKDGKDGVKQVSEPQAVYNGELLWQRLAYTRRAGSSYAVNLDSSIIIRKNGKIIKEISLTSYKTKVMGRLRSLIAAIANTTNDNTHLGQAIEYKYPEGRDIPSPYVRDINVQLSNARIYPDGSYIGSISARGTGYSYAWMVHQIRKDQLNPDTDIWENSSKLIWVKDWGEFEADYSIVDGIGKWAGQHKETTTLASGPGLLLGPLTTISPPADPKKNKPQSIAKIGNFNFKWIIYTDSRKLPRTGIVDEDGNTIPAIYPQYYIFGWHGCGSIDIYHNVGAGDKEAEDWEYYPRDLQSDMNIGPVFRQYGIGRYTTVSGAFNMPVVRELNDGYKFVAKVDDKTGLETLTLQNPEGTTILECNYQYGREIDNIILSSWEKWSVYRLGDTYILLAPSRNLIIIDGKNITIMHEYQVLGCMRTGNYRRRKQLLRKIKILSGVQ